MTPYQVTTTKEDSQFQEIRSPEVKNAMSRVKISPEESEDTNWQIKESSNLKIIQLTIFYVRNRKSKE